VFSHFGVFVPALRFYAAYMTTLPHKDLQTVTRSDLQISMHFTGFVSRNTEIDYEQTYQTRYRSKKIVCT